MTSVRTLPELVYLAILVLASAVYLTGCAANRTEFSAAGNELSGVLTLPEHTNGPVPVAIFVHGDGAANADYYGYYQSFWRTLADRGIASFSWDKPGVGRSSGNWLDQDMEDRASEVVAAAGILAERPEIDAARIGVIGFSQAGWVLPRLANETWLNYLVFASTAIDWTEQGDYLFDRRWAARSESDPDGYRRAIEQDRQFSALLHDDNADHEDYLESYRQLVSTNTVDAMSPSRFHFARRNLHENATAALSDIRVPVFALFGADDLNVDIENSLKVYRRIFDAPPAIDFISRVYPGANHQLAKSDIYNKQVPGWWYAVLFTALGENMFVDGVLDELAQFVAAQSHQDQEPSE